MMWNYRIVHVPNEWGEVEFGLYEVFYNENNIPIARTEEPIDFISDTSENLIKSLRTALHDAERYSVLEDSDFYDLDIDTMVFRRDAEYSNHIAVFREYLNNGLAYNEEWQKEFGGVLDKDIQDALQWLSKHFQELWD